MRPWGQRQLPGRPPSAGQKWRASLDIISALEVNGQIMVFLALHCKKRLTICPSPAGISLTKLSLGIVKLFLARERLVSDIPAGDGKLITFFTVRARILV